MTEKIKSCDDVLHEREMLEDEVDAFLRGRGWEHTSTTPGCLWLWVKNVTWTTLEFPKKDDEWTRVKHERLVMTDKETALHIQRSIDEDSGSLEDR